MAAAIELREVSFAYSEKPVLHGIDLRIEKGEFAALTGAIACGKTTLLMCMNGLIPHIVKGKFEGSVQLAGIDTQGTQMKELARHAGFLFQDPDSQIFSLSVREEVEFALKNFGVQEAERKKKVETILAELSLSHLEDADPSELSQGQKQKVALASVLVYEPEVLLLDEPASSLDHRSCEEIYGFVKELNEKKGTTVVVVEHDTELVAELADRLIVMDAGRIALNGKPDDVFARGVSEFGIKEPCYSRIAREIGLRVKGEQELIEKFRGQK
jgi:energy-coupling factor transport system ATP-binding protein